MHSLITGSQSLAQQLLPLALVGAALLLITYQYVLVRDAILQVFDFTGELLATIANGLDVLAASTRRAVGEIRRHLTDDDRIPLPGLIIAAILLTPILFLLVVVEVRLWGAYFESLFPEQIQVPLIGTVAGGVLTAIVPVAAGFLLGWLVEALFGRFPLPVLNGLSSRDAQARARGLIAIGLCVLWVLLAATVYDAANEVYDGLGASTCALQFAPTGDAPELAIAGPEAADAAAQAGCVAEWKANDRARSIRVILGELTLHLSALIAWVVRAAVGLGLLGGTGALNLAILFAAWLARLIARLIAGLASLVESLLGILRALGSGLVHLLGGLGLPAPSPPAPTGRQLHSSTASTGEAEPKLGPAVLTLPEAESRSVTNGVCPR